METCPNNDIIGILTILSLCTPVLYSGNVESEHVAAGEIVQTTIISDLTTLRLFRPVLLSGNFQSEHVSAGERVQAKILSEH